MRCAPIMSCYSAFRHFSYLSLASLAFFARLTAGTQARLDSLAGLFNKRLHRRQRGRVCQLMTAAHLPLRVPVGSCSCFIYDTTFR